MRKITMMDVSEWDTLVTSTYGRPYSFQQQDGCKSPEVSYLSVPVTDPEDYENKTIPEVVNGDEMGVSFSAWLERDPVQPLPDRSDTFGLGLWWERNFYPHEDMLANDLHAKGILPSGEYAIDISW